MSEKEVRFLVDTHNSRIDNFTYKVLPELLKACGKEVYEENGELMVKDMSNWFLIQRLYKNMDFYSQGKEILDKVRPLGYDVKMDMQSNKLVY